MRKVIYFFLSGCSRQEDRMKIYFLKNFKISGKTKNSRKQIVKQKGRTYLLNYQKDKQHRFTFATLPIRKILPARNPLVAIEEPRARGALTTKHLRPYGSGAGMCVFGKSLPLC